VKYFKNLRFKKQCAREIETSFDFAGLVLGDDSGYKHFVPNGTRTRISHDK